MTGQWYRVARTAGGRQGGTAPSRDSCLLPRFTVRPPAIVLYPRTPQAPACSDVRADAFPPPRHPPRGQAAVPRAMPHRAASPPILSLPTTNYSSPFSHISPFPPVPIISSIQFSSLLFSSHLFFSLLFSSLLFSSLLFSSLLFSSLLFSSLLFSSLLSSPLLSSPLLSSPLLFSSLLFSSLLFSSHLFFSLLSSPLFFSPLLFSSLLFSSLLFSSFLFSCLLYAFRSFPTFLSSYLLFTSFLFPSFLFSSLLLSHLFSLRFRVAQRQSSFALLQLMARAWSEENSRAVTPTANETRESVFLAGWGKMSTEGS